MVVYWFWLLEVLKYLQLFLQCKVGTFLRKVQGSEIYLTNLRKPFESNVLWKKKVYIYGSKDINGWSFTNCEVISSAKTTVWDVKMDCFFLVPQSNFEVIIHFEWIDNHLSNHISITYLWKKLNSVML